MSPALAHPPGTAGGDRLAKSRERFLTAEQVEPNQVRDTILASWWRSRQWNVAADHIDLNYLGDPDLDTPLTRSAMPVLRHLREHLDGQPISVILTDPAGVVLTRMMADHDLDRHLDSVHLAPGFSYAEEFVGTNGIGTALEGGRPMQVFGHEHYAENLEDLACAGVPIHHPISGKTVGAVDLTCWRRDAGPLLMTLARTTADQIRQALLIDSGVREFELLQEYLRACRRTTGIVFALNSDVVMMNEYARQVLDPGDQSVLLGQAAETLASSHAGSVLVDLPTGIKARMYCRPVHTEGRLAGGVVHVKLIELGRRQTTETAGPARLPLPGLVGSGPIWLRGCHQVDAVYSSGEWLALAGEPGVGKLALVRAIYQRRNPAGSFRVLDAAEATGPDWLASAYALLSTEAPGPSPEAAEPSAPETSARHDLDTEGCLVIRHIDQLSPRRLRALAAALRQAQAAGRQRDLWVAVTLGQRAQSPELADLLNSFASTVVLPPLRHHIADLHDLVPFFLSRLDQSRFEQSRFDQSRFEQSRFEQSRADQSGPDQGGRLTCSPEAMQLLLRSSWPGNVEQLWQVLRRVAQHRRTGAIHPNDLPPECRTVSRRLLSPLESLERDAIVQSLVDADGNKVRAAESLGMSRATIYRKIHEYGIVAPTS
jgi:transcriptional regulator of acetoin/glycerol metabolism